jgi:putative transcriptional regulator
MEDHRRRTGERMTYERLAAMTGLSRSTLASLASRGSYNTRLSTIAKLCRALGCQPGDLLAFEEERGSQD